MSDDELDRERRAQAELHAAIERKLLDDDGDARVLTGWVIIYETDTLTRDGRAHAGHLYGPNEMTTWRALGLVEWARRFSLVPDPEDDE